MTKLYARVKQTCENKLEILKKISRDWLMLVMKVTHHENIMKERDIVTHSEPQCSPRGRPGPVSTLQPMCRRWRNQCFRKKIKVQPCLCPDTELYSKPNKADKQNLKYTRMDKCIYNFRARTIFNKTQYPDHRGNDWWLTREKLKISLGPKKSQIVIRQMRKWKGEVIFNMTKRATVPT